MIQILDYFRPATYLGAGSLVLVITIYGTYEMTAHYVATEGFITIFIMSWVLIFAFSTGFMFVLHGIGKFIDMFWVEQEDSSVVEDGEDQAII